MRIEAIRAGLLAVASSLLLGGPAIAQEDGGQPGTQGIQVHGHWIIEIYEGDRLVKRTEFDNALAPEGPLTLADLLAGQDTVFGGGVVLNPGSDAATDLAGIDGSTVDLSTPNSGDDAGKLIYSASYTLDVDHTIDSVAYAVNVGGAFDPTLRLITLKNDGPDLPISVSAYQRVNLEVVISFSG